MKIESFRGEYAFLSNFYKCYLVYDGLMYNSAEAAYQAQKIAPELKGHRTLFTTVSAKAAKELGKEIELRADWESVKADIMREIVKAKFTQNAYLTEKLLSTGEAEIIEGNYWGDYYWGVCKGRGENMLGKILMETRQYLKEGEV